MRWGGAAFSILDSHSVVRRNPSEAANNEGGIPDQVRTGDLRFRKRRGGAKTRFLESPGALLKSVRSETRDALASSTCSTPL